MTSRTDILLKVERASAQFDDWSALLDLIQSAFSYMENRIDPPSSMHLLTPETLASKASQETLFLVREESRLIGCAFADVRDDCVYVGKVSIAQEQQGKGIGKTLMSACEELARECGRDHLEIQVRVELVENHRFFGNLGFIKTGETAHAGYDRPTSITMRKKLA